MNFIVFLALLGFPLLSLGAADSPQCSHLKVSITGFYGDHGEYPSELLDKWSEQSGDLVQLEVSKRQRISSIQLQFFDEQKKQINTMDLMLQKNKTVPFQLIKILRETKPRASEVKVVLNQTKGKSLCHENIEIFKGQETGATEVRNGKK